LAKVLLGYFKGITWFLVVKKPSWESPPMLQTFFGYSKGMLSTIFFSIPLSSKTSTTMQMLGSKLGFSFSFQFCNIEHLAKNFRKIRNFRPFYPPKNHFFPCISLVVYNYQLIVIFRKASKAIYNNSICKLPNY